MTVIYMDSAQLLTNWIESSGQVQKIIEMTKYFIIQIKIEFLMSVDCPVLNKFH